MKRTRLLDRGFTLVEILVALAVTLILMLAAVTLFSTIAKSIHANTASAEGSQRITNAVDLLKKDLAGMAEMSVAAANLPGFEAAVLEIQEGGLCDRDNSGVNSFQGDPDDVLYGVSRGQDVSYSGLFGQQFLVTPGSSGGGTASSSSTTTGSSTTAGTTSTTGSGTTSGSGCGSYVLKIDNNSGPAYTETGSWAYSTGGHGGQWRYNSAAGDSTARATWTFSSLTPGQYRVSATWQQQGNLSNAAPYTILDGSTQLSTVTVNQTTPPLADIVDGANFQNLGTVTIASSTLVVRLAVAGSYVCADAVRIECVSSGTTTGGGTGTTTGGGTTTTGSTTGGTTTGGAPTTQVVVSAQAASKVAEVVWFVHDGTLYRRVLPILPGATLAPMAASDFYATYDVSARQTAANTWVANSVDNLLQRQNRAGHAAAAPHLFTKTEIVNSLTIAGRLGSIAVLDDVRSFDIQVWDPGAPLLLVQQAAGGTTGTTTTSTTGGSTTGGSTTGGSTTGGGCGGYTLKIDNGVAGYSETGAWSPVSGGHGGQWRYNNTASDSTARATWTFSGLTPGQYRVSATWVNQGNLSNAAPYTILDGSTQLSSVTVNQTAAPIADVVDVTNFQNLATVTITSGTLVVRLAVSGNYVCADAVRIQCLP